MNLQYDLSEIDNVAATLINHYDKHHVWAFYGPMGAGKTTLIAAICKNLGFTGNVTSPTFALMNEYATANKVIVHMDWFRIESEEEALKAGLAHAMDEADFCFIEWPEKVPNLIDASVVQFEIEKIEYNSRRIFQR